MVAASSTHARLWTSAKVLAPAVLVVPLLLRVALLVEKQIVARSVDAHGFATDLVVSALFAILLLPLRLVTRWSALLLVPWSIVHYASFEFTRVMNALPPWQSAAYLGDGTFVSASGIVVSRPLLLFFVVALPLALVWIAERRRRAVATPPSRRLVAGSSSLFALTTLVAFLPANREALRWRQSNFLADNAVDFVRPSDRRSDPRAALLPEQREELERLFRSDLDGAPKIVASDPRAGRRPNVLLVLLEGISGTDLPTVARRHGSANPDPPMPRLDAIGRENVLYESFVTHQRGTNRGLYMSLCGDYDKLGTGVAKMTEHAEGADLECLPAVLRRNGYRTVFMQAAPLAFMLKDSFMPKIGFAQTIGGEYFSHAYARSNWGVDDRAFFEQTRTFIQELRREKSPWFVTLLTVGTHHPFPVPDSFATTEPHGSFARAARYADDAVSAFIAGLTEDGAREDTIILVSSDESHGLEEGTDDRAKLLTQNLSFMIALTPTRDRAEVEELFVQSDTALTILDGVGLADERVPFVGRSALRSYSRPRRVFIANQNARTIGMIDSTQRHAWSCDEHFAACDQLDLASPSFVSSRRRISPASGEAIAFLRAAQARAAGEAPSPYRELRLASDRAIPLASRDEQLLYAGQYLDVPADAWLDVDIEVEALGDRGELILTCDLVAEAGNRLLAKTDPEPIAVGESRVLRYSARASEALHWVEARAMARAKSDDPIAVRFRRATLRVSDDALRTD